MLKKNKMLSVPPIMHPKTTRVLSLRRGFVYLLKASVAPIFPVTIAGPSTHRTPLSYSLYGRLKCATEHSLLRLGESYG